MSLFLTGATGQIGMSLLPRLLAQEPVLALVRAKDDAHLDARRTALLAKLPEVDPQRLTLVRGDVALPGLGLSAADRERVLSEADSVLHGAASVRFDMPQEQATRENMASTQEILTLSHALAERGRLIRLDHISTCYVAGDRQGRVFEAECDVGQGFRNSYEWSKCQSEQKVRAAIAAGLPAAIHRPSIVVGDSKTGQTQAFNVLYWPLKLYARGWVNFFPGRPETRVDVVPVDFVADAIVALRQQPATRGRCFHLAAGDAAYSVADLAAHLAARLQRPPLRFVDQGRYRRYVRPVMALGLGLFPTGRAVLRGGAAYMPYFLANPIFDTTEAAAMLGPLQPPDFLSYLDTILQYALERDFRA